jgi:oligopeptide/dipeptide ABC transporter ATP-binding protein
MTPALEVRDLHVSFAGRQRRVEAVRGVSFTVAPATTLVLLGESGSGKSVTARSIMQLNPGSAQYQGTIQVAGNHVMELDERHASDLRGATVALVPQDPTGSLDPLRRVGSQIADVLRRHRIETGRKAALERACALLSEVGIADPRRVARAYPHELSGGMRQRIVIPIAISCSPEVLIADEPTTALDVTVQAQVLRLFRQLQERHGMAILLVTHDVGVARAMGHEVAVMYAGRIVEVGSATDVLDYPLHPYTAGLLAALPSRSVRRGELRAIAGRPPGAGEAVPNTCAFEPRCPSAIASCRASEPALLEIRPGHLGACPPMARPFGINASALATVGGGAELSERTEQ